MPDAMPFPWNSYAVTVTLPATADVPSYRWVRHPTRPHWRNYTRAVPGGTTFAARLSHRLQHTQADTLAPLNAHLFS